mgnify:CR=1 FL=1
MAHYARLDSDNRVVNVIKIANSDCLDKYGMESEAVGIAFCESLFKDGDTYSYRQTSYNNSMRGNYAGIGDLYLENVKTLGVASTDIFISPQPYPSWHIGINTARWFQPDSVRQMPTLTQEQIRDGHHYQWDERLYQSDNSKGWVHLQIKVIDDEEGE